MTTVGTCALCRSEDAELQDSHLLPKWAYKRVADSGNAAPKDPVVITKGRAVITSGQISARFLCRPCEQRRGRHEDYVSRLCWQPNGTFPLMDKLRPIPGLQKIDSDYEFADVVDIDAASAAYFGASTIWMADAMNAGGHISPLAMQLGAEYREQLRRYLNEEQPFPASARISMCVYKPQTGPIELGRAATTPSTKRFEQCHQHKFMICGLEFQLLVGRRLPEHTNCLLHSPRTLVPIISFAGSGLVRGAVELAAGTRPLGKLARQTRDF